MTCLDLTHRHQHNSKRPPDHYLTPAFSPLNLIIIFILIVNIGLAQRNFAKPKSLNMTSTPSLILEIRFCLNTAKTSGILNNIEIKRTAVRSFPIAMPRFNPSSDAVGNAVPATGSAMFKIDIKGGPYQELTLSATVENNRLCIQYRTRTGKLLTGWCGVCHH
jgi:hypothetical protein